MRTQATVTQRALRCSRTIIPTTFAHRHSDDKAQYGVVPTAMCSCEHIILMGGQCWLVPRSREFALEIEMAFAPDRHAEAARLIGMAREMLTSEQGPPRADST